MFSTNQIVKGKTETAFIVLGLRQIDGEDYAQVKPYNIELGRTGRGEFALPCNILRAA